MNQAISNLTTQHLVLTTIGKNKTGLVSELTGLVTECQCNIIDSKMAIFGSEFTMIMLLAGDGPALSQLEMKLPQLAVKLDLLSMMKRTSSHTGLNPEQYLIQIEGPDQAGTIKTLTSFLASNDIDVVSLRSGTSVENNQEWQQAEITIELPMGSNIDNLGKEFERLCHSIKMKCTFNLITIE
ncbi:MAG: hypothetical protein HWE10_14520 [Gammaproteobacteria bacterium]|nr:hypothetical protein [Gammaproteobacteria bacterium]